jgi:asparagine synthetase B (glutamine-hydrolysing)
MKFINADPRFTQTITEDYVFYLAGEPSLNDDFIIDNLRRGDFPSNIRGNFAFYFKDKNRTILAVDHLPTINLFYSEFFCGHIFLRVQRAIKENGLPLTDNHHIIAQTGMFWGESVGDETTRNEIKRVPNASYLEVTPDGNKKIVEYRNVYYQPTGSYSAEELSNIIENIIKKNTSKPFGLLLSSGRDSNTILGYFRKLGIEKDAVYISLKSNKEFASEAPYIEKLSNHYGTKIEWFNTDDWLAKKIDFSADVGYNTAYHRTFSAFQKDVHILFKYAAIRELGHTDKIIFTGEVGDQIFGGERFARILLKFIIQNPNYDVEQLAKIYWNSNLTKFRYLGMGENYLACFLLPEIKKAYEAAVEWFIKIFNKIETDDFCNKIRILSYFERGSHRPYNYSQLPDIKFVHPFTDSYVFDYIWRVPDMAYKNTARTRQISYEIIKDYMVDWPWDWEKTGPAILHNEIKFINNKGTYDAVQLAKRINSN